MKALLPASWAAALARPRLRRPIPKTAAVSAVDPDVTAEMAVDGSALARAATLSDERFAATAVLPPAATARGPMLAGLAVGSLLVGATLLLIGGGRSGGAGDDVGPNPAAAATSRSSAPLASAATLPASPPVHAGAAATGVHLAPFAPVASASAAIAPRRTATTLAAPVAPVNAPVAPVTAPVSRATSTGKSVTPRAAKAGPATRTAVAASNARRECMAQIESARLFLHIARGASNRNSYVVASESQITRILKEKPVGPRVLENIAERMWAQRAAPERTAEWWSSQFAKCESTRRGGATYIVRG